MRVPSPGQPARTRASVSDGGPESCVPSCGHLPLEGELGIQPCRRATGRSACGCHVAGLLYDHLGRPLLSVSPKNRKV
jgi:hypothetical protein